MTPWPNGINEIPISALLDLDECGMSIDKVNRRSGHAYSGVWSENLETIAETLT